MSNDQGPKTDKLRYKQTDRIEARVTCQPFQAGPAGKLEIYARSDGRKTGEQPLNPQNLDQWLDVTEEVHATVNGRVVARELNIQGDSVEWTATLHLRARAAGESDAKASSDSQTGKGYLEPSVPFERLS